MTTTLTKKKPTPRTIAESRRGPASLNIPTAPIQLPPRMQAKWAKVTPETAEVWLDGNKDNRHIRPSVVSRYARAMKEGRWSASPDAITLSTDGRLLNGQHRLSAVIKSGVTVSMFVVTNMPEASFSNMDRGVPRAYADYLRSAGEINAMPLASVIGRAVAYERSVLNLANGALWTIHSGDAVEDVDRNIYLAGHPGVRYSVDRWYQQSRAGVREANPSVMALSHHLITEATTQEIADHFIYQLVTQDREPFGGTIRAAVSGLQRNHRQINEQLAVVLHAWNHWAEGREVAKIILRDGFQRRHIPLVTHVTRPDLSV